MRGAARAVAARAAPWGRGPAAKLAIRRSGLAVPAVAAARGALRLAGNGTGHGAWACGEGGRGEDDLAPEGQAEVRRHADRGRGGASGTDRGVRACGRGERAGVLLLGVVRGAGTGRAEMRWNSESANAIASADRDDGCAGVQERGGKRGRASKRGRQGRVARAEWRLGGWGGVGGNLKEAHLGI